MRAYLLTLLLVLCLAPASAQKDPSPDSLAEAFCQCMQTTEALPPRGQAEECLRKVALRHHQWLRKERDLDARKRSHRMRLVEELVDPLTLNCPYLQTLNVRKDPELRWSDRREETPSAAKFTSPKSPPPDARSKITGEVPAQWWATGKLADRAGGKQLRLRLENGRSLFLDVPPALRREGRFAAGTEVAITYRREWRKAPESRIVNVLTSIRRQDASRGN